MRAIIVKMGVAWGIATAYAKFSRRRPMHFKEMNWMILPIIMQSRKCWSQYRKWEDKEMLRGMKRKATNRKNAAKPGR